MTTLTHTHRTRLNVVLGSMQETLEYLWNRWQDEKQYEDFKDYEKVVISKLPSDFQFLKMTQKPFRIVFLYDGHECSFTVSSKHIKWTAKE